MICIEAGRELIALNRVWYYDDDYHLSAINLLHLSIAFLYKDMNEYFIVINAYHSRISYC